MTTNDERVPGQKPLIHETPAEAEPLDSNEDADEAVEVLQPDGEPVERAPR
jgi:hypothetical protein